MKLLVFLLLAIGTAAIAPDLLIRARSDLVPPDVDLAHAWDDLQYIVRALLLHPLGVGPSIYERPPFSEQRLMVTLMFGLIILTWLGAFVVGGAVALDRWLTTLLAGTIAAIVALYAGGAFKLAERAEARQALESLALMAIVAASAGNLSARALRHLNR